MIKIEFPAYAPAIKRSNSKDFIFDDIRKQWVLLTPEEWVRQHFLQYLQQSLQYPASLIAVEKAIDVNGLLNRFDVVVYNEQIQPWMVVECKEMNVPLSEEVLQQVIRYNSVLQAEFLVITNGAYTMAYGVEQGNFVSLDALPHWEGASSSGIKKNPPESGLE